MGAVSAAIWELREAVSWLGPDGTSQPVTSNLDGAGLAFQRWFHFKEAFSPRLVAEAIASCKTKPTTCIDPFGGSGTTALTCQFFGIRPTTIEVNPFLADIIRSKLARYDTDVLIADRAMLAESVAASDRGSQRQVRQYFDGAPVTLVEPGNGRWIFDVSVAERIMAYCKSIERIDNEEHSRLFRVLLGSVLIDVSNVVVNGKGRRYRSGSKRFVPGDIDKAFDESFQHALYDLCRHDMKRCLDFTVIEGDARVHLLDAEPSDLILFSPPYPNSFDYTDIYNVELWALGYLESQADNQRLRKATLRSHVQIKPTLGVGTLKSDTLVRTLDSLRGAREQLWNRNIPEMIHGYFEDLQTILVHSLERLTPDGCIQMVVGESRYAGVIVRVPQIVRELAAEMGLECEEERSVRVMRDSAQHGGSPTLNETLLRFART